MNDKNKYLIKSIDPATREAEKLAKYKQIMRAKRISIISFFAAPVCVVGPMFYLFERFHLKDTWFIAPMICWVLLVGLPHLYLMVLDVCPWCYSRFFVKNTIRSASVDLWALKKCANCGMPDDKSKKVEDTQH